MSESNYHIRPLTFSDWNTFLELEDEAFPNDQLSEEDFKRSILNQGFFGCFTSGNDEKIIGYLYLILSSDYGHLGRIAVHENFRGKGYGRILMEYAFDFFKKNKCKEVGIYVETHNTTAFTLYEKFGFKTEFESWHFIVLLSQFNKSNNSKSISKDFTLSDISLEELKDLSITFPEINYTELKTGFEKVKNEENPRVRFLGLKKQGELVGFARFAKHFSGSKPFVVTDLEYIDPFIQLLFEYKLPEKDHLRFTFDKNKELAELFKQRGYILHHHLYKMLKKL